MAGYICKSFMWAFSAVLVALAIYAGLYGLASLAIHSAARFTIPATQFLFGFLIVAGVIAVMFVSLLSAIGQDNTKAQAETRTKRRSNTSTMAKDHEKRPTLVANIQKSILFGFGLYLIGLPLAEHLVENWDTLGFALNSVPAPLDLLFNPKDGKTEIFLNGMSLIAGGAALYVVFRDIESKIDQDVLGLLKRIEQHARLVWFNNDILRVVENLTSDFRWGWIKLQKDNPAHRSAQCIWEYGVGRTAMLTLTAFPDMDPRALPFVALVYEDSQTKPWTREFLDTLKRLFDKIKFHIIILDSRGRFAGHITPGELDKLLFQDAQLERNQFLERLSAGNIKLLLEDVGLNKDEEKIVIRGEDNVIDLVRILWKRRDKYAVLLDTEENFQAFITTDDLLYLVGQGLHVD